MMQSSITPQAQQATAQLAGNQQALEERKLTREQMAQQQSQFDSSQAFAGQQAGLDRELTREQMVQQKVMQDEQMRQQRELADREHAYRERQDRITSRIAAAESRMQKLQFMAEQARDAEDAVKLAALNEEAALLRQQIDEATSEASSIRLFNQSFKEASEQTMAGLITAIEQAAQNETAAVQKTSKLESLVSTALAEISQELAKEERSGTPRVGISGAVSVARETLGLRGWESERASRQGLRPIWGLEEIIFEEGVRNTLIKHLGVEQAGSAAVLSQVLARRGITIDERMTEELQKLDSDFLFMFSQATETALGKQLDQLLTAQRDMPENAAPLVRDNLLAQQDQVRAMRQNAAQLRRFAESQPDFQPPEARIAALRETKNQVMAMIANPVNVTSVEGQLTQLDALRDTGQLDEALHNLLTDQTVKMHRLAEQYNSGNLTSQRLMEIEGRAGDLFDALERVNELRMSLLARGASPTQADYAPLFAAMTAYTDMLDDVADTGDVRRSRRR